MMKRVQKRLTSKAWAIACAAMLTMAGCKAEQIEQKPVEPQNVALPPKPTVPGQEWAKGTIFELVDLGQADPLRVSNYGVVVNLRGTGDCTASNAIRKYIISQMTRLGVGNPNNEGLGSVQPQDLMQDPRVAIVRVVAFIPPGAHRGQRMNVLVSALDENNTTSLSGGELWRCDLSPIGDNAMTPGDLVNVMGAAHGPVFVNPAYALDPNLNDPAQTRSLRNGVVMNGGYVQAERPLALRVRSAEERVSRMIEFRIDEEFQDSNTAAARDAGIVFVKVPAKYGKDWEHFAGVMLFTFFNNNPQFQFKKAEELAIEMRKPGAPLPELSYAMEALGPQAMQHLMPLVNDTSRPDVAFYAARAAAFLDNPAASMALAQMARDPRNPFRVPAVETLSRLADSPQILQYLRELLESDEATVRVEAYRALAEHHDPLVTTLTIGEQPNGDGKFLMDIVPSSKPPIVFATRLGNPRIAFIGGETSMRTPMIFTAQNGELSITDNGRGNQSLTLFYRGQDVKEPVKFQLPTDLKVLIARLGGTGPAEERLNFNYPQIVAILGKMSDEGLIAESPMAVAKNASFVLQDMPSGYNTSVLTAQPIDPGGRPNGDIVPATQPAAAPSASGSAALVPQ